MRLRPLKGGFETETNLQGYITTWHSNEAGSSLYEAFRCSGEGSTGRMWLSWQNSAAPPPSARCHASWVVFSPGQPSRSNDSAQPSRRLWHVARSLASCHLTSSTTAHHVGEMCPMHFTLFMWGRWVETGDGLFSLSIWRLIAPLGELWECKYKCKCKYESMQSVTLHPLAAGGDGEVLPITWLKHKGALGLWGGFRPCRANKQPLTSFSQWVWSKRFTQVLTLIDSMVLHSRWRDAFFNYKSPGMPERFGMPEVKSRRWIW